MSDAPDAAPWTIKAFPVEARLKALRAAKQSKQTMGEWLTDVVNHATNPHTANRVFVPGKRKPAKLPEIDLPGLAVALNATVGAIQASGEPVPKALGLDASRTLRVYLRAARGLPERQPVRPTVSLDGQTDAPEAFTDAPLPAIEFDAYDQEPQPSGNGHDSMPP